MTTPPTKGYSMLWRYERAHIEMACRAIMAYRGHRVRKVHALLSGLGIDVTIDNGHTIRLHDWEIVEAI